METPVEEILADEMQETPIMPEDIEEEPVQVQQVYQQYETPRSTIDVVKEHMGKRNEYLNAIAVFFVLLLATFGIISFPLRGAPLMWLDKMDNSTKLSKFGAVIVSIIGTIIYFVLRLLAKVLGIDV